MRRQMKTMKKEQRSPRHALLMAGDGILYNPPSPRVTRRRRRRRYHLLSFRLNPHRRFRGCRPMDLPRIDRVQGRRLVSSLEDSLGFCNTASLSFASLLGALILFRISEYFKRRGVKREIPAGKKTMVAMVARQGRELQRYTSSGGRRVVGCIPYRLKMSDPCTDDIDEQVQVLVISSQKGHGMMFPKGGWELDETMKQAASREALEEAGVHGHVESNLGKWMYKSNRYNIFYEGIMFPLNVTEELSCWPEMEVRKRRWVSVAEAREGCQHDWMREALERLLARLREQNSEA